MFSTLLSTQPLVAAVPKTVQWSRFPQKLFILTDYLYWRLQSFLKKKLLWFQHCCKESKGNSTVAIAETKQNPAPNQRFVLSFLSDTAVGIRPF